MTPAGAKWAKKLNTVTVFWGNLCFPKRSKDNYERVGDDDFSHLLEHALSCVHCSEYKFLRKIIH